jgi:hypothetical protein
MSDVLYTVIILCMYIRTNYRRITADEEYIRFLCKSLVRTIIESRAYVYNDD